MKFKTIVFLVIIILILVLGGFLGYKIYKDKIEFTRIQEILQNTKEETQIEENKTQEKIMSEKKINIYNGNERPIAIMIDNHSGAWPQAGLNSAYMVYEIIVEGGETRLMALFKGVDIAKIGPVRSSRHYFLDYAMENDAIYVHYGWSPQAESDISTYKVQNINGLVQSSSDFWRVKDKKSPHNVLTSTEKIKDIAQKKGYSLTSNATSILKYVAEDINLEEGLEATTVKIPYSNLQNVEYNYDEENKVYIRTARGKAQTDYETKENLNTKNIIIEFIENYTLNDSENKGRQGIKNIGTFDGYYITNGKAIKIKCTKSSRTEKTVYKDLNGKEIELNDGNTWVQICPKDSDVSFE